MPAMSQYKRAYFINKLGLSEPVSLSMNDLEYRYYVSVSGIPKGTLADHRQAWLATKGYTKLSAYLSSLGLTGALSSQLSTYYSTFM